MRPSIVPQPLSGLLLVPLVDRTRRNHGLEHATITLLAQKIRGLSLVGRSTPNGFYLHGKVSTDAVAEAAHEALRRMKAGEVDLAVHPNCGTNFVTKGIAAGLAAYFGFMGANSFRSRWARLPIVALLCTAALIFAQPLGLVIQRDITTSGEMRGMRIVSIKRNERGGIITHFVATAD
ncbi:MAG: DUF6391 domain-containing protein [Anaerolineales bacterium]